MSDGVRLMEAEFSPPSSTEEGAHEGANQYNISVPRNHQGYSPTVTENTSQLSTSSPATQVNVVADDDVVVLSRTTFEEAQNRSRRIAERTVNVNVEPAFIGLVRMKREEEMSTVYDVRRQQRRTRVARRPITINYEPVILEAIEGTSSSSLQERQHLVASSSSSVPSVVPPPPQPPHGSTFICPICIGPFVEEVATKCGHIFCKHCIRTAIVMDKKCPTCWCKVTNSQLIRIYLPVIN